MPVNDDPPRTYREVEERVSAIARRAEGAPQALLDILHADEAFVFFGGSAPSSHAPDAGSDRDQHAHDRDDRLFETPVHAALVKGDVHSSGESLMADRPDNTHAEDAPRHAEGTSAPAGEGVPAELPPEEPDTDVGDERVSRVDEPLHDATSTADAELRQATSEPMFHDEQTDLVAGEDTGEGPDALTVAPPTPPADLPPEDTAEQVDRAAGGIHADEEEQGDEEDLCRAVQDLEAAAALPSDSDPAEYYELDDERSGAPQSVAADDPGDIVAEMYEDAEASEATPVPDEPAEEPPLPAVGEDDASTVAVAVAAAVPDPEAEPPRPVTPSPEGSPAPPRTRGAGLKRVASMALVPVGMLVVGFALWNLSGRLLAPSDGPGAPDVIPQAEPPASLPSTVAAERAVAPSATEPPAAPPPPVATDEPMAEISPPDTDPALADAAAPEDTPDTPAVPSAPIVIPPPQEAPDPATDLSATGSTTSQLPAELQSLTSGESAADPTSRPPGHDGTPVSDAPLVAAALVPEEEDAPEDPLMDHDGLHQLSAVMDEYGGRIGTAEVPSEPDIARLGERPVWGAVPQHPDEVLRELLRDSPASIKEEQYLNTKGGHDLAGLSRRVLTQEEDLQQRFTEIGDRALREAQLAGSVLEEGKRIEGYDYLAPSGVFDGALVAHDATGAVFRAIVGATVAFAEGARHGAVAVHASDQTAVVFEDGFYIGGPGSPRMPVSEHYYYRGPRTAVDGMFLYDRRSSQVVHADHRTPLRFGESEALPLLFDHGGHRIYFGADAATSTFVIPDPDVNFWAEMGTAWTVIDIYLDPSGVERHVLHDLTRGGYLRTEVGAPGAFPLSGAVQAVTASGALIVDGVGAVHRGSLFLRTPRPPALLRDAGANPTVAVAP